MITQQELKDLLHYEPSTGVFTWRKSLSNNVKIGQTAGTAATGGYLLCRLKYRRYMLHSLAWMYVHGYFPDHQKEAVNHINGNRSDNRIANLRLATRREYTANGRKRTNCSSRLKGVTVHKGRFIAQIGTNGTVLRLGSYATEEEAHAAYMAAAKEEFGAFARAK
jgi:hypothetical protein